VITERPRADFLAGEHTCQQSTDDAADAVHAERVEGIVVANALSASRRKEADDAAAMPMTTAGVDRRSPMPA